MFRFITLILEIPDRMCCNDASAPKISQNWVKPIGISKAKKKTDSEPMEIPHDFFLITPAWKFHFFFVDP